MLKLNFDSLPHQEKFLSDTETRDLALVGGRGCGKTRCLTDKLITLSALQAGYVGAALSPNGPMASKVLIPQMHEALERCGFKESDGLARPLTYRFHKSDRRFDLRIGRRPTTLYILSAENVRGALGLNLAFFGLDEADTIAPTLAREAWLKLKGALRAGNPLYRQAVAVSTPEGYGFMYQYWEQEVKAAAAELASPNLSAERTQELQAIVNRRLIRGRTMDNPFLGAEFIDQLRASYPAQYIDAYMNGEFVNLEGTPVYWKFDQELNRTTKTLADFPNHILHLGLDFNKGINACVVSVVYNNAVYAIDEIYGQRDTELLAREIKRRYPMHVANNALRFYPDASGFEGIQNLKRHFYEFGPDGKPNFRYGAANPRVDKRIASVNEKFKPVNGAPEAFVNMQRCPELAKGLIQQVYVNGVPDKESGVDHALDGFGYFIYKNWPLTGQVSARVS